jgi:hypothetical protein
MTESELNTFFETYPRSMKYVHRKMRYDDTLLKIDAMRIVACEIADNLKLVAYYKKTYGFESYDTRDGISMLMAAPMTVVLKKCENVSNFQSIEPHAKKTELCCSQCQTRSPRLKFETELDFVYCSRNCARIHALIGYQ